MKNFYIIAGALKFIEANLCREISQQDIAEACCCSLSALQKTWRYCTHTSIKEYISKRRLACSAKDILAGDTSIIDVAFKYQYNSPEVFTRAFTRMWGVAPSKFSVKWRNAALFPPFVVNDEDFSGGIIMKRKVDLTELYDFLRSKAGTYVLCFDICRLMPINNTYGTKAGDAVILEAYRRIDELADGDMVVFRIGGDEFAMITGLSDSAEVEKLAEKVILHNDTPIDFEGTQIPVAIRVGAVKYNERPFRYNELFTELQSTIDNTDTPDRVIFYDK